MAGSPSLEDIKQIAEQRGKRLGFLIASLSVDNEVKNALLDLLPEMNVRQLDQLTDILEANFLQSATGSVEESLKYGLAEIDNEFKQKIDAVGEKASKQIAKIEQLLRQKQ